MPALLPLALLAGLWAAPADPIVEIATGTALACARRASGAVECWGQNSWDASPERCLWSWNRTEYPCHRRPTRVPIPEAVHISAGNEVACALLTSGRVACWGYNLSGALGDGTTDGRTRPVIALGVRGATQLETGGFHTCIVDVQGAVRCWGRNVAGELGDGGHGDRAQPGEPVPGLRGVTGLTLGSFHACVLVDGGRVACWGDNGNGQLGDGTYLPRAKPVIVRGLPPMAEVVAGHQATCARTAAGRVWCWGAVWWFAPGLPVNAEASEPPGRAQRADAERPPGTSEASASGRESNGQSPRPIELPATHDVRQLALGLARVCALVGDERRVFCWGSGSSGALGDGTYGDAPTPRRVGDLAGVTQLDAAWDNTCFLKDGQVACWGQNPFGQLGDGGTDDRWRPRP